MGVFCGDSEACKLTIIGDPDGADDHMNKIIEMRPSVYSSPIDNLNNQVFTIFKAQPIDGCSAIQ